MFPTQLQLTLPDWIADAVDAERVYVDDEARVGLAIDLARANVERKTGGPFGAAIFSEDGKLISVGVNRVIPTNCSIAHAEMMAYMQNIIGFSRRDFSCRGFDWRSQRRSP
jgi:hypothetical protein